MSTQANPHFDKWNQYQRQSMFGGWTRIDMLLAIYDQAIKSLEKVQEAVANHQAQDYFKHLMASQKAILAIHAGLRPDEDDIAFNIARLLHFVLQCIESDNFADAIKILRNLRNGFTNIQEEASRLEHQGVIPPIQSMEHFVAQA